MNVVLYTALFGTNSRDGLHQPAQSVPVEPGVRLVCFTDRYTTRRAGRWVLRPSACPHPLDSRRTARYHKAFGLELFADADAVVWADACLALRAPVLRLVADARASGAPVVTFKHPDRDCVYDEFEACRRLGKDREDVMRQQIDGYRFLGYPAHNGLAETSCVVRFRTPEALAFSRAWWAELAAHSVRDQLSFDVTAWRQGLAYGHLAGRRDKSPYFQYHARPRPSRPRRGRR